METRWGYEDAASPVRLKKMMEEIFLNVFGIRAHVSTPLHDFAEFVRQNYNCFLDDSGQSYDLEVMFSPDAGDRAAADAGSSFVMLWQLPPAIPRIRGPSWDS